jgi:hypothetical protein
MTNTERVNTLELNTGDIVWTHGMRVELGARGSRVTGNDKIVVWFAGRVLNPNDVNARLVPVSFRTDDRYPDYAPGTFWQIQGNDLADWNRETN